MTTTNTAAAAPTLRAKIGVVAGLSALSLTTVGLFAGALLSGSFGLLGWAMALGLSIALAVGAVVGPLMGKGKGLAVFAVTLLSVGLGLGRMKHGLEEAQVAADAPRGKAIAARTACITAVTDKYASKVANYTGSYPTKMNLKWSAAETKETTECRATHAIPEKVMVTLGSLGAKEWILIMAPVVVEFAGAILIKVIGAGTAAWMSPVARREDTVPVARHAVLNGVDIDALDNEARRGLDVVAGTWHGAKLGAAKARNGVMWPTLAAAKRTVYIGSKPALQMVGQPVRINRRARKTNVVRLPAPANTP